MKKQLVQVGFFTPDLQRQIDSEFDSVKAELADAGLRATVQGLITRSNYQLPQALLEGLPALRVIATSGVGFDGIPVSYAQQRGIVVTNTPGLLDAAVCELGIGLLLAMLREIPQSDRFVRDGAWAQSVYPLTSSLSGKRIGIIGLGRIGKGMAARLEAFGVSLAYSGRRQEESPYRHVASPLALAQAVDVMLVCCKGGEQTRHLVNAALLEALGKGWLVNLSRGSVVDEWALFEALTKGSLRGAALDVYEQEPLVESPLLGLKNVVFSPHAGSATVETRAAMLRLTLDNLHAVLGGGAALTPVPTVD